MVWLRSQVLFDAGEGLSVVVCRKAPGEYTLGVANNGLEPRPFKIVSHVGVLEEVRELVLDQSEKAAVGYLPTGSEGANVGVSDAATISGGDVRLFAARVKEQGVQEIPHVAPASGPKGRILPLREGRSIKESILARPTFFEHYDGVTVDWRYLRDRDAEAIAREKGWLERQGVRIYVDFTSGINLYPDLRLTNNDEPEYQASMKAVDAVMAKMGVLGAKDLILSIHRDPENNFTREQTQSGFETTLKDLCAACRRTGNHGIPAYEPQGRQSRPDREADGQGRGAEPAPCREHGHADAEQGRTRRIWAERSRASWGSGSRARLEMTSGSSCGPPINPSRRRVQRKRFVRCSLRHRECPSRLMRSTRHTTMSTATQRP